MTQSPFFTSLKNRGLIKISGNDARTFMQGLITNDINKLDDEPCVYACMLSPQGKFLFDFFITEQDNTLILDCEGGERLVQFSKLLTMYKLRANANIETHDDVQVYGIIGAKYGHKDPRHEDMGYRSFEKPAQLEERSFEDWDYHRIKLTIPDGSRDLIPQKSTMDEARMDQINAVDYNKGCYVGQELTARMHYRGLGKKHLQTVTLADMPEKAELRSSCKDIGLALVRT